MIRRRLAPLLWSVWVFSVPSGAPSLPTASAPQIPVRIPAPPATLRTAADARACLSRADRLTALTDQDKLLLCRCSTTALDCYVDASRTTRYSKDQILELCLGTPFELAYRSCGLSG
jgi:hypothetical protein